MTDFFVRKEPQRNNRSGVRGVCWCPRTRRWRASVTRHRKHYHVGYFGDIAEAAVAVRAARAQLYKVAAAAERAAA